MNFLQAIHYRKAEFLATLSLRLGHYLLWHVLLGVYVENVELLWCIPTFTTLLTFITFLQSVPFVLGRYNERGSRFTAILMAFAKALKMASIL